MTKLSTWDDDALLEEVLASPRKGYFPMPDLRAIERPGWMQIVTPSFKNGGFNEVSLSVLGDDEADAVIDATIAEYRALGLRFRWNVVPESRPLDLASRLLARGLAKVEVIAMARTLGPEPVAPLPSRERVHVEQVVEAEALAVFNDVMARGWSVDPAPLARAHEILFAIPDRAQRLFVAYRDGVPAGVASYIAFPRSAYLVGAVVLPEHRNAGVYRALASARMAHAHAHGITLATSHAVADTSAPILTRRGFVTVCPFLSFHG